MLINKRNEPCTLGATENISPGNDELLNYVQANIGFGRLYSWCVQLLLGNVF